MPASVSPVVFVPLASQSQTTCHVVAFSCDMSLAALTFLQMFRQAIYNAWCISSLRSGWWTEEAGSLVSGWRPAVCWVSSQRPFRGEGLQPKIGWVRTRRSSGSVTAKNDSVYTVCPYSIGKIHKALFRRKRLNVLLCCATIMWIKLNLKLYIIRGSGSNYAPCNEYKQYWSE